MKKKDILFTQDDFIFSYRAAGILVHNNKILMQKPKNDDVYSFIGGHVSSCETSEEALKREYMEELHADININNLFAIGEVFFPWKSKPCHQISLYYKVELKNLSDIQLNGTFPGYDELNGKRYDLDFCWLDLNTLNAVKIYPVELIPYIIENSNNIVHFISRQL